jgi:hypothetical protein
MKTFKLHRILSLLLWLFVGLLSIILVDTAVSFLAGFSLWIAFAVGLLGAGAVFAWSVYKYKQEMGAQMEEKRRFCTYDLNDGYEPPTVAECEKKLERIYKDLDIRVERQRQSTG